MFRNKDNPRFFETMMCICGRGGDLLKHKFTDEVKCVECINDLLIEMAKDEEKEGYYADKSYNELLMEREA